MREEIPYDDDLAGHEQPGHGLDQPLLRPMPINEREGDNFESPIGQSSPTTANTGAPASQSQKDYPQPDRLRLEDEADEYDPDM